jgi:hypothetical protein
MIEAAGSFETLNLSTTKHSITFQKTIIRDFQCCENLGSPDSNLLELQKCVISVVSDFFRLTREKKFEI